MTAADVEIAVGDVVHIAACCDAVKEAMVAVDLEATSAPVDIRILQADHELHQDPSRDQANDGAFALAEAAGALRE